VEEGVGEGGTSTVGSVAVGGGLVPIPVVGVTEGSPPVGVAQPINVRLTTSIPRAYRTRLIDSLSSVFMRILLYLKGSEDSSSGKRGLLTLYKLHKLGILPQLLSDTIG
jgi:hypothetical protein